MIQIDGSTKIIGIFGFPIKHTLSPAIHNAAFQHLKLNLIYLPFQIKSENLETAIKSLELLDIPGINVTAPHKENAVKYLDKIDPLAKKIGAINTIVVNDGQLTGYNTDGSGFIKSLEVRGFKLAGKKILLMGSGGAGKSIGVTLCTSVPKIKKLFIYDLDVKKSLELFQKVKTTNKAKLVTKKTELNEIFGEIDMLINATPVGMGKNDPCIIAPGLLTKNIFVYDIVYNRETALIKAAKKAGCRHMNGLDMLLFQGILAFQLWTKQKAPVELMRKALKNALTQKTSQK
ncbi:MAG: shikimate dehydrogenase [Elusimicrobia bacterium]|nr:shikimate dehydrogenase [Elusimicrobiota bacterium]MBU2614356.1 shikimate dehydrogenase [Elusimicrobiota bacterium]